MIRLNELFHLSYTLVSVAPFLLSAFQITKDVAVGEGNRGTCDLEEVDAFGFEYLFDFLLYLFIYQKKSG